MMGLHLAQMSSNHKNLDPKLLLFKDGRETAESNARPKCEKADTSESEASD